MALSQDTSQDTKRWPERQPPINNLPDELLIDIFDFYRQEYGDESNYYHWWTTKLGWFKLLHVCKRWRSVMFASSSRLDLCFVLTPKLPSWAFMPRQQKQMEFLVQGDMKTILSRRFPPLPIVINYDSCRLLRRGLNARDIDRMVEAFRRPDRIRGIALDTISTPDFDKLFEVAKSPLPALESLELRDADRELDIPATFLGEGSDYSKLRTLKLHRISLPSISRFLSSARALTHLDLVIEPNVGLQPTTSLFLSYLQGMPCLYRLDLVIFDIIDDLAEPTENFSLSKLTIFHYCGYSAFLNALTAVFIVPSLRDVYFSLDTTSPPVPHIVRFINNIGERFYAFSLYFDSEDCLRLEFLTHSEYMGHDLPRFTLRSRILSDELVRQLSSAFPAKLVTVQDLSVVLNGLKPEDQKDGMYFIPWRSFLLQFPRVKALHLEGVDNLRVASALDNGDGPLTLPALEEIELCSDARGGPLQASDALEQAAIFEPFVSARQQAGLPVKVVLAVFGTPGIFGWGIIKLVKQVCSEERFIAVYRGKTDGGLSVY